MMWCALILAGFLPLLWYSQKEATGGKFWWTFCLMVGAKKCPMAVEGVVVPQKEGIPTCRDGTLLKKEAWLIFWVSVAGVLCWEDRMCCLGVEGAARSRVPSPAGFFWQKLWGCWVRQGSHRKHQRWWGWRHQAGGDEQRGKSWMVLWDLKWFLVVFGAWSTDFGNYESQEQVNSLLVLFSVTC